MCPFKVGEKVICIDPNEGIHIGCLYFITHIRKDVDIYLVRVKDEQDREIPFEYFSYRFKHIVKHKSRNLPSWF